MNTEKQTCPSCGRPCPKTTLSRQQASRENGKKGGRPKKNEENNKEDLEVDRHDDTVVEANQGPINPERENE